MFNIYLTRMKILSRDRMNILWTLIFPIFLATCFYFVLTGAYSSDALDTISVAISSTTESSAENSYDGILDTLESVEISDGVPMFNVTETDEDTAADMLLNNEITAYIVCGDEVNIYVNDSGIYQSITKTVVETYLQVENTLTNLYVNGADISSIDIESLYDSDEYVVTSSEMSSDPDVILSYYYSLIAMACLFGGYLGLRELTDIQADLSTKGCRISIAPTSKYKVVLSSLGAAYTVQVIANMLLLLFLALILKVDFGNKFLLVALVALLGSLCGIFFGAMIAVLLKGSEDSKAGIVTAFSLIGCFLAGLMFVQMKFIVEKFIPFLQYINPATLITDAFYSLYYYDTLSRYILNISILSGFTILFAIVTIIKLRRLQYASL